MSDAVSSAAPAPSEAPASLEASADTEGLITEESEEGDGDEAETQAADEAKKALKKKFSIKANKKMRDIELDLGNDAEIQRYLEKAVAADEKFEEAANMRKAVEELVKELKSNPKAILSHPSIGLDLKAFAESIMNQELEDMNKSPEQKRIEEMERQLKEFESEKKRLEDEKTAAERARMDAEALDELDSQVTAALSKSELPKSPYVLKRIADTMIEAVNLGYTDVKVEQILPYVEQQILGEINRLFDEAPEATASKLMERIVGKKHLDKYRKGKISKVKSADSARSVKDSGAKAAPKADAPEAKPVKFKDLYGRF